MISGYTGGLGASLLCLPGGRKETGRPEPLPHTCFELPRKNVVIQKRVKECANVPKLPGLVAGIRVKISGSFDGPGNTNFPGILKVTYPRGVEQLRD